jgi:FHS family L-fucose permease-like MFS transporter
MHEAPNKPRCRRHGSFQWAIDWAIFTTSFFMSVMYPTIFALGIRGLDRNTKIGGSLIVMAIVGGAVLTPVMGLVSETTKSIAIAYSVPLLCYVGVALYSFLGSGVHRTSIAPLTENI